MKIFELLNGKKTYLLGLAMVIVGFYQQDHQMVMEGLGFMFIRLGIAKNGVPTK